MTTKRTTEKKGEGITTAIPNKGLSGSRAVSLVSNFVSVDSDVLRNPLLGIAATVICYFVEYYRKLLK